MSIRNLVHGALLLGLLCAPTLAQQENQSQGGTLPPVVVEPPEETTTTNVTPQVFDTLGQTLSFPGLNNLQFGQPGPFGETTGVLRSQGSLFDTPFAADITTREEIVEKQAPDLFQALQQEVGVLMQSTAAGQASPFIRGVTGQQVLILVDGIRLNNSVFRFGPNQYFNTIDPGMVDHIEVLRGGGGVFWGSDAIGGTINVVTRGPSWQYSNNYLAPEFTQYFNTANISPYSRLNVQGWVGPAGVFTGGSFLNVRDLDTSWDNFGRQPGTNYQQQAGDIKFNLLLTDNQLLTFSAQHVELNDVPRSDRFPGYPGDRNNSNTLGGARFFDPQQRDLMYVRYQAVDVLGLADAVTLTASYNRQRENQKRGVPTTRFQEIDVETTGLQLASVKDFGDFGKVVGGADWYHDDVDSPFGGSAPGPIIPDDAFYERIGAFLNYDLPLTQRLDVVAGARYELVDLEATPNVSGTPVFISPHYKDWIWQTGLVYEVLPEVNLVGSISKGFRAPNLDELTANNPNVLQMGMDLPSLGLVPETSYSYEAGVKTNFAGLRSQSFVYWTDLNNNIVPISAGPNQFARANQDSFIQGVETNGEYVFANGWSVYGNYWYTFGYNEVTGGPLSRIPPQQGILGMRYRADDLRTYFALYTWMVRRQDLLDPVRDVSDERIPIGGTPGYATLNMRVGRAFGDIGQHRLSLSLENITDQPYLVHGSGVFGSGVTGRFGYTWAP